MKESRAGDCQKERGNLFYKGLWSHVDGLNREKEREPRVGKFGSGDLEAGSVLRPSRGCVMVYRGGHGKRGHWIHL